MPVADTTKGIIKRSRAKVFRRLSFRRRDNDGEYETAWQDIPNRYIKKWGKVSHGVQSDVTANFFKYSGLNIELSNQDGFFNDVNDVRSFFSGKLSIYRTLVRVQAGYIDDDGNELPTMPSLYFGIIGEGINRQDNGVINLETHHISKIFDEFNCANIKNLGVTQTASDIITKIRNHTDDNSVAIFQKYITNWNIQSTTLNYDIATTTQLEGNSCWRIMRKLAEAEDRLLFINPDGEFVFQTKAQPSTSSWHFSGSNDTDLSFGKNIIGKISVSEKIKNVFNRVRIRFAADNTTGSFKIKEEDWNWADNSSSFLYGVRTYEYANEWLNSTSASTVADAIFDKFRLPIEQVKITSKFLPGIEIRDMVDITHKTGVGTRVGDRYGQSLYGSAIFGQYSRGSIELSEKRYLITNISHDIDKFTTILTMDAV